jgi:hypothetical protein
MSDEGILFGRETEGGFTCNLRRDRDGNYKVVVQGIIASVEELAALVTELNRYADFFPEK